MDLDTLNPAQRAAVTAKPGAHLVIAGAGTGKTRTLVHRVAWLIEQGVNPRSILLLTFTRRAANEMLQRARGLVGHRAGLVRGGTFHSVANRALRTWAPSLGYTRDFTILDRSDAESLVGLVRTDMGLGGKQRRFPRARTVLNMLSKQVNTGADLEELLEEGWPQYLDDLADIEALGEAYVLRKKHQNVMDYDDLLTHLGVLLQTEERARRKLSGDCLHVLVDEYQDTNRVQAKIAAYLASEHGNLMVVGDEAQSIYAFRGATVDNILQFPTMFEGTTVTTLEENYRSTQPILELANGVLASARDGYEKHLVAASAEARQATERPRLVEVADEATQADYVVDRLLTLREQGVPLQQMAVLVRSGFHANVLEVALANANLPYRKFGGLKFFDAAHVKDVFALLRVVANPTDELAWLRVFTWFDGVGAKTAAALTQATISAVPPRFDPAPYERRKFGPALAHLARLLDGAAEQREDLPALLDTLVDWYVDLLPHLYADDHPKRKRDLEALPVLAAQHPTLDDFLAAVSLDPVETAEAEQASKDDEWLTLSTVHSAKGLEWRVVFVLSLRDGHFPSGQSIDDDDALEEERRLFYVAVTRAQRELHLLQPRFVRSRFGMGAMTCQLLDTVDGLYGLVDRHTWSHDGGVAIERDDELATLERLRKLMDLF